MSEADIKTLNLFQKINYIMQKVESVTKGSTVAITQNSSYKAVSHDDVTALLHRPLTEARIIAMPNMESAEVEHFTTEKTYQGNTTKNFSYMVKVWASVTFINADDPKDCITTKCFAYAMDSGDKATGKAYSMAIKYCYLKVFMLESCDDEESRDYELNSYGYGKADGGYENNKNNHSNNKPTNNNPGDSSSKPASEAQLKAIKKIYGPDFKVKANLSSSEASELIKNAPKNK